ncbi:phosphoribosylaminoimidazolesuccinocarboxamide synthase [Kibdelosporangium philippinense]|uniref:Phosphoribosylaminoimidazole-succinocarboxamide synthase n=1 Tax=Kibdelosporangium philippinense TaxID=211113 RepID=A0ABS8ZC12_9PSEU|nr:phosphoribosylaminoimidazolesuccinocarboxamide synthase [Kibdelosporangium philippinense]MCE7005330.1 phosphoribosylaminoimidazolesuccinocarboxamide synthase [Kibdelosporangium philippinense]
MPSLTEYPQVAAGKIRELYAVDDDHLLLVASDKISAYDYVLPTTIPDKARVLTAMSVFWFDLLDVPNHLVAWDDPRIPEEVRGRALLVRKLKMLPVECVARGYLTGSGLIDYSKTGGVCGVPLPAGLVEASKLPEAIFTPTTKAEVGQHDEAIDFDAVRATVGDSLAVQLRDLTVATYSKAAEHALTRGMILADTKFEFGLDESGEIVLGDEVLTPDSSRFWAVDVYQEGKVQPSFDKQIVRNWLTSAESGWDRHSGEAPPELPEHVVEATRSRYIEAYEIVSGKSFSDWP